MIKSARKADKKVLVDPSLTSDYSKYQGATVITPNRQETSSAVGFDIINAQTADKAAEDLARRFKLDAVVITLDKEGAFLKTKDISQIIPTRSRSVYDVTGAGDMVLATLSITLAAGFDYKTAVQLSNVTGGIEVEKFGTVTVTIEEVADEIVRQGKSGKVRSIDLLLDELTWHRKGKNIIVFTNGCFDVIHRGHIEYLEFCKAQGDVVVVGLNSDKSVKAIKGPERPINNQHDRVAILAALEVVDYITVFDEPDPLNLIKKVKPDILVKGQDWAEKGVVGREFVESLGGKVLLAPLVEGKSSTVMIEKMKSLEAKS
jgi:D-beta-D-heptose 7-phosphate kinase/D-beta-D-heptose 1-phosphate adenosyltransferase